MTQTDAQGRYSFHDISNQADYELMLAEDGLLEDSQKRIAGWFLRVGQYAQYNQHLRLGAAHSLANANFQLLIDNEATPFYNRPNVAPAFEGNGKPLAYWKFQSSGTGKQDISNLADLEARADALIGCPTSFAGDELAQNLRAAALNAAAGRGFFEPYDLVQTWYLKFAAHVHCSNISSADDRALALRFAEAINDADDMDTM